MKINQNVIYCFLLFLFLSKPTISNSQESCNCPKAEKLKPQLVSYFNKGDFKSAKAIITKIDKQTKTKACKSMCYNLLAQVAIVEKNYKLARNYLNKESALLKNLNCPERLGRHYSAYSTFYNFLNKHDSAVHVSLLGLTQAELANDTATQVRLCSNIGSFFMQMKQYKKALKYEEKGIRLANKQGDDYSKAMIFSQIGQIYLLLYKESKNKEYLDKAFKSGEIGLKSAKNARLLPLVLDSYGLLCQYYMYKKQYLKTLNYADSILTISPRESNLFNRNLEVAYSKKSQAYYELGNYQLAKLNADSALYYGNLFNVQMTITPHELIYKSSKKLGDSKTALASFERMTFLNDSLFNIEKNERIAQLEEKYNQAKNEKTIKELNQEDEIKALRIRILFFIVILIVLILIFGFLIYRQKTLKKNQHILETEQRLNRSRMNPHFFFNALTTLQGLALKENDGKKVAVNLFKFSSLMRKTLESSYNDEVTIDTELSFIKQYIELQQLKDPEQFVFNITINEDVEIDAILVPSMLIQPFLENSIEHGFSGINYQGILTLSIYVKEKELVLKIEDNGKGLKSNDSEKSHISRATKITRDRLELLKKTTKENAHFTINENSKNGVEINIFLPLRYK